MKGRDYWRNEMAKGIIRAQSGDLQVLEALLDEIEALEKSQLTPVASDGASCSCPSGMFSSVDGNCSWCGQPVTPRA